MYNTGQKFYEANRNTQLYVLKKIHTLVCKEVCNRAVTYQPPQDS